MERVDVDYLIEGMNKLAEKITTAAKHGQSEIIDKNGEYAIKDLLLTFHDFKEAYQSLDTARKRLYHVYDTLDKVVVPEALERNGCEDGIRIQINDDLGYNFRRATKYSAKTIDKENLYAWLRANGDGDIITETVNSGTLASYLKEKMLEEGVEPPPETAELTTYYGVGMNKYTPK